MNYEEVPKATEITSSTAEDEQTPDRTSLLRKIGKKAWNIAYGTVVPGGTIYGMVHTVNPNLPPHYSLGGSLVAGLTLNQGYNAWQARKEKRKSKQVPPEDNHEITDTDAPVV